MSASTAHEIGIVHYPGAQVAWALPICSASLARLRSINLASIAVSWSVAAAEARLWHKSQPLNRKRQRPDWPSAIRRQKP